MLLNGTSSRAETSALGGLTASGTARTIAAIVNRTSSSGFRNICSLLTSGGVTVLDMTFNGTTMLAEVGAGSSTGPTVGTGKMYLAEDKASGSATPRFHKQIYGTDAAVAHSAGSGAINDTGTVAKISVGTFDTASDWFAGDIYVLAVWNRQLSDAEHDWLASSMVAWLMLQPDFLIIELGAALPTNIPDLSGKGAPLTTLTNLAVSTASVPVSMGGVILPVTHPAAGGGGDQTVSPSLVDSAAAVYSPTVSPGSVTVSPSLVDAGPSVFSPTVSPGSVTVSPALVDAAAQVFSPTVSLGGVTVSPDLVDGGAQVFSPVVAPGAVTVAPGLVDSGAQVFVPVVSPGVVTISPALVDSGPLVFVPTVTRAGDAAGVSGTLPLLGAG